ncbi:MAG: DNA polymerase III subunit beta [Cyanobacteriota bacterium]
MKLVCSQTELSASLQLVSRAVAGRPTHPVLANVLLQADAVTGRLSLTGFDLSLGIQTAISAQVETSGAITLPARLFGEIVSRLSSDSPITLICAPDQEQVELVSASGSYQMRGMAAEDFPDLPLKQDSAPIELGVDALVKGLRGTLFASSGDEAKQLLTGVHLALDGSGLECAATDGHRLAVLNLANTGTHPSDQVADGLEAGQSAEPFAVTVPARSLRELERLLSGRQSSEPVSLFCERGQVVFQCANEVLTSPSLEGTYPNYRQLIPPSFSRSLVVDRRAFLSALERVAVLADQHNNVVRIQSETREGRLLIQADVQDVGRGQETLPALRLDGEDLQIAFNVRYVLEGLKVLPADTVILQANSPTTPVVIAPYDREEDVIDPSFTYLVMPVQIRN